MVYNRYNRRAQIGFFGNCRILGHFKGVLLKKTWIRGFALLCYGATPFPASSRTFFVRSRAQSDCKSMQMKKGIGEREEKKSIARRATDLKEEERDCLQSNMAP